MALTNTTQFANRYGLDIELYELGTDIADGSATPLMTIDFANVCDVDISSERTWATGGQGHVNKIAFADPIQGTFTISTQIMTAQLLALIAGEDIASASTEITFRNVAHVTPKYYIVKATTVWQDADGATYAEDIIFHKACARRAYNISYTGEGDPTSVDIEFDALEDNDGNVMSIKKAEIDANT